jgi:hypothetical protein
MYQEFTNPLLATCNTRSLPLYLANSYTPRDATEDESVTVDVDLCSSLLRARGRSVGDDYAAGAMSVINVSKVSS